MTGREDEPMLTTMLLGYAAGLGLTWVVLGVAGAVRRHVAWRSRRQVSDAPVLDEQMLA
jgi:hypothetical protein